jgi:predicted tellurium resistance membrane protein TerC
MEDHKYTTQEALDNIVAIEATISKLKKNKSYYQVTMFGLGKSLICEPLCIMLGCMKFQFLVWNVESGLRLLYFTCTYVLWSRA